MVEVHLFLTQVEDTCVEKKTLVKVIKYRLKWTQSIKVTLHLKDISAGHFCATLKQTVGFVPAVPEHTTKILACCVSFTGSQIATFCAGEASRLRPIPQSFLFFKVVLSRLRSSAVHYVL